MRRKPLTETKSPHRVGSDDSLEARLPANPQAVLAERLRAAVENAAIASGESMKVLRLAVAEFTVTLRNQGTTPEAVLISLKAVISANVLPSRWHVASAYDPHLRDTISTWCIEEYFRERSR